MKYIKQHGFALFWLFAIADITFILVELEKFRILTKPFLMPILLTTLMLRVGFSKHKGSKRILIAALLLATAGDILLLRGEDPLFFIAGLSAFLIMQLLYSIYFLRIKPFMLRNFVAIVASFLLVAIIASAFSYLLWKRIGDYKIPLIVYSAFLALMFASAVNVYFYRLTKSLAIDGFIPGAMLFVVSDFILASNMFYFKEAFIGIAVMATYCAAQYYLTRGFIKHLR